MRFHQNDMISFSISLLCLTLFMDLLRKCVSYTFLFMPLLLSLLEFVLYELQAKQAFMEFFYFFLIYLVLCIDPLLLIMLSILREILTQVMFLSFLSLNRHKIRFDEIVVVKNMILEKSVLLSF